MLRMFVAAVAVLAICAGGLLAEEVKGKLKSVDAEKGVITVTVGDKDQEFKADKDTKIVNAAGREVPDGLKGRIFQRPSVQVTITTEKKDDKELVKEVKVGPAIRPIKPGQVNPIPIKPIQVKPMQIKPLPIKPIQPPPPPPNPGEEKKDK